MRWQKNFHCFFGDTYITIQTQQFVTDANGWFKENGSRTYDHLPIWKGMLMLEGITRQARLNKHKTRVAPFRDGYTITFEGTK